MKLKQELDKLKVNAEYPELYPFLNCEVSYYSYNKRLGVCFLHFTLPKKLILKYFANGGKDDYVEVGDMEVTVMPHKNFGYLRIFSRVF